MAKRLCLNGEAVAKRHGRPDRADEGFIQTVRRAADIPPSDDGARHGTVLEPRRHRAELRAHHFVVVRAAVLDGRFEPASHARLAA